MEAKKWSTKHLVRIALLAAMAYVLYYFETPIPPFPAFLKLDASDVPVILAAYILGPVSAVLVELIKNLLHLFLNGKTGGVGELANFIVGSAFVIPLGIMVSKKLNKATVVMGSLAATVSMVLFACIFNYFILIPLYMNTTPAETFSLIIGAIVPFNAIKGVFLSVVGFVCYKVFRPVLKFIAN